MTAGTGTSADVTLLYPHDPLSGYRFLCDTGAHASMVPALPSERTCAPGGAAGSMLPRMVNVSGKTVRVFGRRRMQLCFGGRRYDWDFVTADMTFHIIGADFLHAHGLVVDLRNRRLLDASDLKARVCAPASDQTAQLPSAAADGDDFVRLLAHFPDLQSPDFSSATVRHGVEHHLPTTGPPVFARARRLDPAKLAVAKEEFEEMERLGIVRRSDSPSSLKRMEDGGRVGTTVDSTM